MANRVKEDKISRTYDIYLTAIGQPPGGCCSVHIYTQTIQGTSQNKQYIEQHKKYIEQHNNQEQRGPCSVFAGFTLAFALQLRKKHGKTSVRVVIHKHGVSKILRTCINQGRIRWNELGKSMRNMAEHIFLERCPRHLHSYLFCFGEQRRVSKAYDLSQSLTFLKTCITAMSQRQDFSKNTRTICSVSQNRKIHKLQTVAQ